MGAVGDLQSQIQALQLQRQRYLQKVLLMGYECAQMERERRQEELCAAWEALQQSRPIAVQASLSQF